MTRRRLTSAQRGIWFAQALDPTSPAYVTADVVEADASVDPHALAVAIHAALSEAEGLSMRFGADASGEPCQEPGDEPIAVPVLDLASAEEAERWMAVDRARPFDLAFGPLCRQAVLRLADGRVWWYQAIHHLATDAYATSLLLRRVAAHLAGETPPPFGTLSALDDLDAAYAAGGQREADAAFWAGELAGLAEAPTIADAAPAPVEPPSTWRPPHRHEAVLAAPPAAPRALALVAVYLHRLTGAEDVVLGVPWMGRLGSPAARVPACWINVLPLRLAIAPHRTVADLAAEAATRLKALGRHGRHRYEDLRRDVGLERRLVGPLINVKPFTRAIELGGRPAHVRNLAAGPVDDLTITLSGDRLILEADPARYSDADARAHLDRLAALLATDEDGPCGRLEVTAPDAELAAARGPRRAVPDTTLWAQLADQARRTPEAVAVVARDATLTYAELHRRAEALAVRLAARGAGPGEVVGVAVDRSAELMVALLAVLRTGAAYLPLEPDAPADRTAAMREDARPVCVIDGNGLGRGAREAATASVGPGPGPAPADLAYVLYTSGSTGRPKGVEISHRAIVNRLAWMQDAFGLGPGSRVLLKTPLGFDVSVWELFWPLIAGATLVVAAPGAHRDPEALARTIRDHAVDTVHFVPSMLAAFVARPDVAAPCAGTLTRVITSGEALTSELAERCLAVLPGVELHNLYGPTEAAVDVTHWACASGDATIPIGFPVWNTDAYVLDPALRPCAVGAPGELYLAGVQLADGYRGRPALTAERFVADPFGPPGSRMYRTGDLARRRADGALEYLGRGDQQVKVRGVRIEPGEVEAALLRHPAVAQVAVVAREDRPGDVRLVAYAVLDERAPAEPAALRRHAAALLPGAMVPSAVVVLDALPVSPSGKLDRRALPVPPRDGVVGGRAPADPREELLCGLFAEALGVARVGADDSLFDLGGHSLLAAGLAGRIREALGADITIGALFAAPTPAALAARMRDDGAAADALEPVLTLRPGAPGTSAPPVFCVHPAGGLGWCYAPLAARLPDRPVVALQADADACDATLEALAARYVARVRARQPSGPYTLLGWSVGGVIAHAMAVLLRDAGEEVEQLVLLDAYPGDQWRHLAPPTEQEALRALLLMGGAEEDSAATLDDALAVLAARGSALASLPADALAGVVRTVAHTAGLMRAASHRVFDGDMVLFVAAAPRAEDWLTPRAWEPYVAGTIDVVAVEGTHPQLVHPPAAARVADRIARTGALA